MERVPVKSSMIRSVGFDVATSLMEIEIGSEGKPTSIYLVQEVSPTGELAMLHSAMMVDGASIGRTYNTRIKSNPNFVVTKIEDAA